MRTYTRVVVTVGLLVMVPGAVEVAPAAAGGGGCHRDMELGPTEGRGDTVELTGFCMSPTALRVERRTEVTFVNRDEVSHNLYGSGMLVHDLAPEGRVAFRFDEDGTYPYACTLHPGMVGAVVVGDGRRLVADTTSIVPVEIQAEVGAAGEPPTTMSLAPVPAAASREADDALPVAPAAVALGAVAGVAYLAGRRRVNAS